MRRGGFRRGGVELWWPTNVKIRGLNIVPKPADVTAGGGGWGPMWTNWDWAGWVKPQIDNAKTLGANCVKISGLGVQYTGTLYPATATFQSRLQQFLTYCQTNGLYVYYNVTSGAPEFGTATNTQILTAATATVGVVNAYTNVIGLDLGNEVGNQFMPQAMVQPMWAAVKPVTSLPVTFSLSCTSAADITNSTTVFVAPYVDFFDFHPYYGVDAGTMTKTADYASFRTQSYYKPFFVGECGRAWDGVTTTADARWVALGNLSGASDCMGVIGFCIADYDNTAGNQFGIYSSSLVGPRTTYSTPFGSWPAHA